jgi:hypothetical protein
MTLYAKIENGSIAKYPYNLGDLRSDNKNTSFPKDALSRSDVLSDFGVSEVSEVAPALKAGYKYSEANPESDGSGGWRQVWVEELKTVDELVDTDITKVTAPQVSIDEGLEPGVPEWDGERWNQTWVVTQHSAGNNTGIPYVDNRRREYGYPEQQIEFITENGLDAWQTRVAEIKAKHPKS